MKVTLEFDTNSEDLINTLPTDGIVTVTWAYDFQPSPQAPGNQDYKQTGHRAVITSISSGLANASEPSDVGGEGGIRTHGGLLTSPLFESAGRRDAACYQGSQKAVLNTDWGSPMTPEVAR
jgi:hypothetical protein